MSSSKANSDSLCAPGCFSCAAGEPHSSLSNSTIDALQEILAIHYERATYLERKVWGGKASVDHVVLLSLLVEEQTIIKNIKAELKFEEEKLMEQDLEAEKQGILKGKRDKEVEKYALRNKAASDTNRDGNESAVLAWRHEVRASSQEVGQSDEWVDVSLANDDGDVEREDKKESSGEV